MSDEQLIDQRIAGPLIFISHDTKDAELAEAFSMLLKNVSTGVLKSFRSSDHKGTQGIQYGTDWYKEVMSKLDEASDVVCLLTTRSLDRPWLLYEAGVAKGKPDTPVYGITLGIPLERAAGPFAQFQNCNDDEESLTKLVMQLLKRMPASDPDRDVVLAQVKAFKNKVSKILSETADSDLSAPTSAELSANSVAQMLEEVKVMFQDLPSRLEGRVTYGQRLFRGRRRMHPEMLFDITHSMMEEPGDPVGLLVVLGLLRDDFPWLYELGMEAYRTLRGRSTRAIEVAAGRFQRALEMTLHGPLSFELGYEDKEVHILLRETERAFDKCVSRSLGLMRSPENMSRTASSGSKSRIKGLSQEQLDRIDG